MIDIKYIVWNGSRTEAFVTDDYCLAYEVRKSASTNCVACDGTPSPVAVAFCEAWYKDNCTLEAIITTDGVISIVGHDDLTNDQKVLREWAQSKK